MRFGYLIMAHDGFDQLALLLGRLLDGNADRATIHVDARVAIPSALVESVARFGGRATLLSERVASRWAHSNQIEAVRRLLAAGLVHAPDMLHLLSGRDWPLATRARIASDVVALPGACFVDVDDHAMAERMDRFAFAQLVGVERRSPSMRWRMERFARIANASLERIGVRRSRPYGAWARGSQWWSLPAEPARHVLRELDALSQSRRLRLTSCADEHVVQSILLASPFADRIQRNRRLIRWPEGASSPAVLGPADVAERGDAWFGRKFLIERDRSFLALPD